MPFGILQFKQCILYEHTTVLLCVPLLTVRNLDLMVTCHALFLQTLSIFFIVATLITEVAFNITYVAENEA